MFGDTNVKELPKTVDTVELFWQDGSEAKYVVTNELWSDKDGFLKLMLRDGKTISVNTRYLKTYILENVEP